MSAHSDQPQTTDEDNSPDIEPAVLHELAEAAAAIINARRLTRWGYVEDHCGNALDDIKKAIRVATGRCGDE